MVILHYLAAPIQAGITRYSEELADALDACGEPVRRVPVRPFEANILGRRTGGYLSIQLQNVVRPWRKGDVLHSTHAFAPSRRADVATLHDLFPLDYAAELDVAAVELRSFRRRLQGLVHRGAQWITPTEVVKQGLLDTVAGLPDERVHVTYEGISERFRPPAARSQPAPAFLHHGPVVLAVGDLNPRKRMDWLLQAALDVPEARIVHVGTGLVRRRAWREQQQREAGIEKQLGDRFIRLGHLSDEQLIQAYQSADLFVLPSIDEGFGLPPLEALACGTPVAVTDRPVFREVLRDQAQFFQDAEGLARILAQARRPTAKQRKANHEWVRRHYDWSGCAARTVAVYDQVRG